MKVRHKFFNGKKYYYGKSMNRWCSVIDTRNLLSRDTWNYYYPGDPILKGEVIHHENEDSSDDRIENLRKMTLEKHGILHNTGEHHTEETKQKLRDMNVKEKNPMFGKHLSDKAKEEISKKISGENHHLFGKHRSDNVKQKLRNYWTNDNRQRLRMLYLGIKNSDRKGVKKK